MQVSEGGLSYRDAGVDIDAAGRAMRGIAGLLRSTATSDTLSEIGSFGGLYRVPRDVANPVLVASTDGVGTKLKLAFLTGRHDSVGQDLVNHCVNDILVQGARPLFFLDYIGVGRLEPGTVESLVEGIARACRENGCALLGGETAEMPDFYAPGEYDLAGTVVGIVDEAHVIDGRRIRAGDAMLALASSGLHTNGYSLARRVVFDCLHLALDDPFPEADESVADVLLRTHRSYLSALWPLIERGDVHGLAHITGGGMLDNIPRILPAGLAAHVKLSSWEIPGVFQVLQAAGDIPQTEMFRTFNMGVGMIVITAPERADDLVRELGTAGERAWRVGSIERGDGNVVLA
jgi:phosphoribosylformylglycinamidine cyclo-ligase